MHLCAHHHPKLRYVPLAANVRKRVAKRRRLSDPTFTLSIRRRFEADLVRRFKKLRADIWKSIVTYDGFGLRTNEPAPPNSFAFPRSGDKVSSFMDWLYAQQNSGILEVQRGATLSSAARNSWANVYIDSAYQRGLRQAGNELRGAGASISDRYLDTAFLQPVHADAVGLIYTRTFSELEGVTRAMDQQISRVLAQGLAEGRGMMDVARDIVDRVDSIGITRARMIARTEIVAAHAEASLNMYEEAEVEGVAVVAEWATAGDNAVCPECEDMEGKTFLLDEARGMIPLHPNCRCAFIPSIEDARGVSLQ
ncbi:MAG: minor capsid protein [Xanthobacteraceae bacterium]|nr:minor capsid protein [Xanthobacteraceae bacterium]